MRPAAGTTAGQTTGTTRTDRALAVLERAGNKLPEPFVLFVGLFAVIGVVSTGMALADVRVTVPGAEEETVIRGLLTGEGVAWFFTTVVERRSAGSSSGPRTSRSRSIR